MLAALVLCRWVHYTAALLLFGASLFTWGLAPPPLASMLNSRWRWATLAGALLAATLGGWLLLEAGMMGGGWDQALRIDTLGAVLFGTDFGQAWQIHGLLVLALLAAMATRRGALVWPASALVLASLGLIGHAAMQAGPIGWFHRVNLGLHLLTGGFWLGGLLPLLPTLRVLRDPHRHHDAMIALRRFSTLGHAAVGLVVVTGIANTVLILGIGPFDLSSPYRDLLASKVALVGVMIGLALINRYRVVPRLRDRPDGVTAILHNSLAELALGGVVIALVSLFGLLDPRS